MHHYRQNEILKLKRVDGSWCEGEHQIATLFVDYFSSLFRSNELAASNMEEVLTATPWVVTHDMNQFLLAKFTKSEVDLALKQMSPLNAPGPNRMPLIFYQHYWVKIGVDVVQAILTWLNSDTIYPSLNHTYITLILKVKCPQQVTKFHPISLCNILYKLMSKVLANRLKKFLPDISSDCQSAFQSDKAISDNILVAFESLHHMKHKKVGKSSFMAMKLDMSKAYVRVEWIFLCRLMEKMGF